MGDEFKDIDDSEIDKLTKEEHENFMALHKANKALTDQLLDASISNDDSQDEVRQKARAFALQRLPGALNTIGDLSENAEKESTRLAAARTIWAIASATSVKDGTDPLENLFKRLESGNSEDS